MYPIDALKRKLDQLMKHPDNPDLYHEIGVLLYQLKDWNNAEMYLQKSYQLDKGNAEVLFDYAQLLYEQSQWEKSVSIYNEYLNIHPIDLEVIEKAGNAYYLMGDDESAQSMYERLKSEWREEHP